MTINKNLKTILGKQLKQKYHITLVKQIKNVYQSVYLLTEIITFSMCVWFMFYNYRFNFIQIIKDSVSPNDLDSI